MSSPFSLPYQLPPIKLLPAAADSAGRTSSYVSLRNALKAWIVCEVNQGNAATVQFTPLQAKDSSGTGSKAIATAPIWLNNDTSTSTGSDALAAQAAAANFTTDATTKDKLVIFELTPEAILDIANGFNHIALQTGASNAANITSAALHVLGAYQGQNPPTSYV
jgi:hypothetical protein